MSESASSREGVQATNEGAGVLAPAEVQAYSDAYVEASQTSNELVEPDPALVRVPEPTEPPPGEDPAQPQQPPSPGGLGVLRYLQQSSRALVNQRARQVTVSTLFPEGDEFAPFVRRFTALMMLSTLIAVLGILADSTAVVIGAMLVAPLMSPILGLSVAVVMGWPRRALRQSAIAATGATGAIALASLTSLVFPGSPNPLPAELMARTSPNLLDLGVALVAGAAGAYSQARRQAADAITGVAVAVALVPPLAVVGITLQLGEWKLALGSFLLFLANVVGIILAASVTFVACGLVPAARLGKNMVAPGLRLALLAALLMIIPLHLSRQQVLPVGDAEDVTGAIRVFFDDAGILGDLVDASATIDDDTATVHVMVAGGGTTTPSPAALAASLAENFGLAVEVNVYVLDDDATTSVAEP